MNNLKTISTILANGTRIDYNVILTFKSLLNQRNYVVYTDNTYDQNRKLRFYAAIYDPLLPNPFIGEPTTKEEWTEIINVINTIIPIH